MIRTWDGRGGSGKSFAAVAYLYNRYKQGRAIYSNTPLVDLRIKWRQDLNSGMGMWVPVNAMTFGIDWADGYVRTLDEILHLDNCDVFLDEMYAWVNSRNHRDIPQSFCNFLAQDRREGVDLVATHRNFDGLPKEVRENTCERSRSTRMGPYIIQEVFDPQVPAERVKRYLLVSPSIYDLYQTYARVGDRYGKGYGLGKRTGYMSSQGSRRLIDLNEYGPNGIDIKVTPKQLLCLRRKFGDEHCGYYRIERKVGRKYFTPAVSYVQGPCRPNLKHPAYDAFVIKRGHVAQGAIGSTNFLSDHKPVTVSIYR